MSGEVEIRSCPNALTSLSIPRRHPVDVGVLHDYVQPAAGAAAPMGSAAGAHLRDRLLKRPEPRIPGSCQAAVAMGSRLAIALLLLGAHQLGDLGPHQTCAST